MPNAAPAVSEPWGHAWQCLSPGSRRTTGADMRSVAAASRPGRGRGTSPTGATSPAPGAAVWCTTPTVARIVTALIAAPPVPGPSERRSAGRGGAPAIGSSGSPATPAELNLPLPAATPAIARPCAANAPTDELPRSGLFLSAASLRNRPDRRTPDGRTRPRLQGLGRAARASRRPPQAGMRQFRIAADPRSPSQICQ
jgi:hypothetical protein